MSTLVNMPLVVERKTHRPNGGAMACRFESCPAALILDEAFEVGSVDPSEAAKSFVQRKMAAYATISSFESWSLTSVRGGEQSTHVPSAYLSSLA